MANENLSTLLKDYEHKRVLAELDLEKRKEDLYSLYPQLEKIESELNSYAIATTKSILFHKKDASLKKLTFKIDSLRKKREAILTSNGYDISYLKPFYECDLCKDTGYIEENNKKVMCSCLKQRLLDLSYNKSNLSNLNKENFSTFNANIFSDEVDLSKYGQNISPRKNILNIKDKALYFVDNFDDPSVKNLLFTGNTGLRKKLYV